MKNSLNKIQLREFGFLIGFTFPLMIGFVLPVIWGHNFRLWTLWVGVCFITVAIIKPKLLANPYKAWMLLGHMLGWVNSSIILGIVYFFVVQPISITMRVFGYDPLKKKKLRLKTYRENIKSKKIDLTRIF